MKELTKEEKIIIGLALSHYDGINSIKAQEIYNKVIE